MTTENRMSQAMTPERIAERREMPETRRDEMTIQQTELRKLTNSEKLIFGLARSTGAPVYWCTTHPLFSAKDGKCPACGRTGQRFNPQKQGA